jgi:hypothetical protein
MLTLFEKLAAKLHSRLTFIVAALILALALLLWVLFATSADTQDRWLIPTVLFNAWLLLLFSGARLFTHVPRPASASESWHMRTGTRIRRFFYHLFAWFMLLVSVALVTVTMQLAMAWLRMHL